MFKKDDEEFCAQTLSLLTCGVVRSFRGKLFEISFDEKKIEFN